MPGAVLRGPHALWRARAARRRVFRHPGQRLAGRGRRGRCPCRRAAPTSTSGRCDGYHEASSCCRAAAAPRRAADAPLPLEARTRLMANLRRSDPGVRRELGTLVPQHRPRRRADRARPFPRRLPREVKWRRFAHALPAGSDRQDRARYRLQRRLLFDRDEAARRRPRARDRPRRGLSEAGAFRGGDDRARHRIRAALGLRRRRASPSASTSCCFSASSTICAIRCWRSI